MRDNHLRSSNSDQRLTLARQILETALQAVSPFSLVKNAVRCDSTKLFIGQETISLTSTTKLWVVAIGKAAPYLASSLLQIIDLPIMGGICLYLPPRPVDIPPLQLLPSSHPLPDEKSLRAAEEILTLGQSLKEEDLLLMLISGGGSAQLTLPLPGLTLEEKRWVTRELMKSGANIRELNVVRKHLSAIKGGRLAKAAYPARIINLVVSDVIGNDLEVIASGPTWYDSSTFLDAYHVLTRYNLWDRCPSPVKKIITQGNEGFLPETPKQNDPVFSRVKSVIIGDNVTALQAASKKAKNLGLEPVIITNRDQGEAREAAHIYAHLIASIIKSGQPRAKPLLLLSGGELTVTVRGRGRGGRNQEFILATLLEMKKIGLNEGEWLIMSVGTDGIDGPTDAAGAWIDGRTWERVRKRSLHPEKFLRENDSYNFFRQLDQLIFTGPTRTNVMDLRLFLLF